jgi:uncharacterized protein (DUF2147 family)
MRVNLLAAIGVAAFLTTTSLNADDAVTIEGKWLSANGEGWIRIELTEDGPEGTIAGSPGDPYGDNSPRKDDKNPDPALRDQPLHGLRIMRGFETDGPGKWKNGRIYDPNSGKTYRCKLTLVDANTVKLRGYLGVSLFGRNEVWTRVID